MVNTTVIGCSCVMTTSGVRAVRLHNIARIDQPQTDAPGNRRNQVAEGDLDLVVPNCPLVDLHRAFVLQNEFFLVVQQLLGNGVARPRLAVTLRVHLCLRQQI